MKHLKPFYIFGFCLAMFILPQPLVGQESNDTSKLTIDRIFESDEFQSDHFRQPRWIEDGKAYTSLEISETKPEFRDIVRYETKSGEHSVLIAAAQLVPDGADEPLEISNYKWSANKEMLLIFTNTHRVWRYNTKGDYWILNLKTSTLTQVGKNLPESSLMFAKFSPDDTRIAFVSKHNLYVENLDDGNINQLTFDGTEDLINGTFDWAYEEEFFCRDGFSWSPDGETIAYWQVDASGIKDFLMINNTDSLYSLPFRLNTQKLVKNLRWQKLA